MEATDVATTCSIKVLARFRPSTEEESDAGESQCTSSSSCDCKPACGMCVSPLAFAWTLLGLHDVKLMPKSSAVKFGKHTFTFDAVLYVKFGCLVGLERPPL